RAHRLGGSARRLPGAGSRHRVVGAAGGDAVLMRRGYAETEVGQIHYRELGSGPTVVLLHQMASSSTMFEPAMPYFAEPLRTVAMDRLGFALPDPPPRPDGVIRWFVRAVVGLLDHLGAWPGADNVEIDGDDGVATLDPAGFAAPIVKFLDAGRSRT